MRTFRQAFRSARRLRAEVPAFRPDVIHVQYGGAMDLAVLPLLTRASIPVVVTAHCGRAWLHLGRAPRLACKLLRRADRVLSISTDQRELFEGAGLAPERIVRVGSLIEEGFFEGPAPHRVTPSSGADRTALYLGRIAPEKGLETVVAALGRLVPEQRPRFAAVGPVDPHYADHLTRAAQSAGLGPSFELRPPVAGVEARRAALDGADLLLHPTLSDVTPLVVVEAMARELPVLASALPGTVELLSGTGATFPPGDAHALAACLRRLAEDPTWLDPCAGSRGRAVSEVFRPRMAALETLGVFEELLGGAERRSAA